MSSHSPNVDKDYYISRYIGQSVSTPENLFNSPNYPDFIFIYLVLMCALHRYHMPFNLHLQEYHDFTAAVDYFSFLFHLFITISNFIFKVNLIYFHPHRQEHFYYSLFSFIATNHIIHLLEYHFLH